MKRFLIPATLLLILLTAFGCSNTDNVLVPETKTPIFATLSSEPKVYHGEGWIGPAGGTISITGGTKATFPAGALDKEAYITVTAEVYSNENKIHYIFGPHGTVFNQPVELTVKWSYLDDYEGPLELWYLEDNGEVILVEDAIVSETTSRIIFNVNHFSEYYFPRP